MPISTELDRIPMAFAEMTLRRERAEPLHRQLADAVRDAVLTGRLALGTKLPPSRALAGFLGVSRNTVVAAYEQLTAEGFAVARVGYGTRIADVAPETLLRAQSLDPATPRIASAADPALGVSERGQRLGGQRLTQQIIARPFSPGVPDIDDFPRLEFARLLSRHLRIAGSDRLSYGEPRGEPALCAAIAHHCNTYRGTQCTAERVVITASSHAAFRVAAHVLADAGETVWMEEPGYHNAREIFRHEGLDVRPVPVDGDGLRIEWAEAEPGLPAPRLVYVTPSHQHPLGMTLSLPRRLALLERVRQSGGWILEDDYDSEFRYSGRPLPALQGLAADGRVIYVSTFSKALAPGLKLAFMIAPAHLVPALTHAVTAFSASPPRFLQTALAEFITEGNFASHIRRLRRTYEERQRVLMAAAARHFPEQVRLTENHTGQQIPALLPPDVDDVAIQDEAEAAGIGCHAISRSCIGEPKTQGLLLGFGGAPEKLIEPAARKLGTILRRHLDA